MTGTSNTAEVTSIDTLAMEARYQRAQNLMQGVWTKKIALNTTLFPVWFEESDCFWYERETRENIETLADNEQASAVYGRQYRLVNAKTATNDLAFDHELLATALAESSKENVNANNLPITKVEMELSQFPSDSSVAVVRFSAFNKRWIFETATSLCSEIESLADSEVISPNGEYAIFLRDYNLWLRDLKTREEKALTRDGEEFHAYGVVSAGWGWQLPGSVQARWSPDSKRIFTLQRDSRRVKPLPVVHHVPKDGSLRPTVEYPRVAHPGDEHVEEFRLLAIEVETGKHQPACYCQIPVARNSWVFFDANLGWWATDSRRAYFIDVARDSKSARVLEFDTHTGAIKLLFDETSDTHISFMHNDDDLSCTFMPLPESDELIWFSERSGWAHLYLYDLNIG